MSARCDRVAFLSWILTFTVLNAFGLRAQSSRQDNRLERLSSEADLVSKGQVISSRALTNAAFPDWAQPHASRFRLISVLKGKPETSEPVLWHYTAGPMAWS